MNDRHTVRGILALPVLGGFGALFAWGCSGLPPFGHFHGFYGQLLNAITLPQRHTTNVVTAIVFDYRGFDTLGEEFILFAAVVGVTILLREDDVQSRVAREDVVHSDTVRFFGVPMLGVVVLVGLWLAAFGVVTPGGGFQGGVAIAGGLTLLYLTVGYREWRRRTKVHLLDPFEGVGAGAYVAVGLAALISAAPFLHNLLGPGRPGTLVSGGSISLLNWAVALEVTAANLVLYSEFLQRLVSPKERA